MRRAGVAIIIVLLLLQPIGAVVLWLTRGQNTALLAFVPSWILLLLQVIYRVWDRAYFAVEALRIKLAGGSALWGARAEYRCDAIDRELVKRIGQVLLKADPKGGRLIAEEPLKVVLHTHELSVVIAGSLGIHGAYPESDSGFLVVEVLPHTWAFNKAVEVATGIVPSLFEDVRRNIVCTGEKYSSQITFQGGNPYFGFFVRNLQFHNVDRFVVEMKIPIPGDPEPARVTAQKETLSIVASKSSSLATASKRYLTLSAT